MQKNYFERLTDKEKLDVIGRVVDQLVRTTDACFKLSEEEKSVVAQCAMGGVTKVFDKRYKALYNKMYAHKEW
jgi:dihydroorotase-like cyclic amidohydrolase